MGAKILVVDDESDIRKTLKKILSKEGYEVDTADRGDSALAMLREGTYDLVVTDMKMPAMDGLTLMKKIREENGEIGLIVLTGYGTVENVVQAMGECGADFYLTKPLEDIDRLITGIDHALTVRELKSSNKRLLQRLQESNEELEKRVSERTVQLLRAKEEAEAGNLAKSQFLSNISHEFRTPLNGIMGFTEILMAEISSTLTPDQRDLFESILKSADRLEELVKNILDYAKFTMNENGQAFTPINVENILEENIFSIREKSGKTGIHWSMTVDGLPETIFAAESCMRRTLSHLLSNAVKFTPEEGVVLTRARGIPRQSLPASPVFDTQIEDYLEISVEDKGIGLKKEDLERIFRRFEQVDGSRSRHYEGAGLGLSIAKKLVEAGGGRIWAESDGPGKGSVFRFVLPWTKKAEPA